MIAQEDEELFPWLLGIHRKAGQFLMNVAEAGLRADYNNYPLMRPFLLAMKEKHPEYYAIELEKMTRDGSASQEQMATKEQLTEALQFALDKFNDQEPLVAQHLLERYIIVKREYD